MCFHPVRCLGIKINRDGPFYSPLEWRDLPSLNSVYFPSSFIQLLCYQHPHHYLYIPPFLVLFLFLGPFSTVRSWQNLSLASVFIKFTSQSSEREGSRQGIGWMAEESQARGKSHCYSLTLLMLTFLCDAFSFLPPRKSTVVLGSSHPFDEARTVEGSVLTLKHEVCSPSPALYCL